VHWCHCAKVTRSDSLMVSRYTCETEVPWYLGILEAWCHCTIALRSIALWYHGSMVPWSVSRHHGVIIHGSVGFKRKAWLDKPQHAKEPSPKQGPWPDTDTLGQIKRRKKRPWPKVLTRNIVANGFIRTPSYQLWCCQVLACLSRTAETHLMSRQAKARNIKFKL